MFYNLYSAEFSSEIKIEKNCCKYQIETNINYLTLFNNNNNCSNNLELIKINTKEYTEYFNKFDRQITAVLNINSILYPFLVEKIIYNEKMILIVSLKDIIFRHMKIRKLPLGKFNAIIYLDGIRINFNKCLKPCVNYNNLLPKKFNDIKLSKREKKLLICNGEIIIIKDNKKTIIENTTPRSYNVIMTGDVLINENKIIFNKINNFLMFQTYSCNNKQLNTRRNIYNVNIDAFKKGFDKKNHNLLININNKYFVNQIKDIKVCKSKVILNLSSNNLPQGNFNNINIFIDPVFSASSCGTAFFTCNNTDSNPYGHYDWGTACCNYSINDYGICTNELGAYACGSNKIQNVCIGNRDSVVQACKGSNRPYYPVYNCCDCSNSGGPSDRIC